ncbi:MAG: hypothetical protein K0S11_840 [Gammaproteobacteria bacterium]|jgi:hypothetical protein|nr:hypothetical protein [Gammaproteobacteria bacterium]
MSFKRLLFVFSAILLCFSINSYAANRTSHHPSPKNENEVLLINTTPYYANAYASYSDGTGEQIQLYPAGSTGNLDRIYIDLTKQGYPPIQWVYFDVRDAYYNQCLLKTYVYYPGGMVTTNSSGCFGS